jgi:hypothetical protein
MILKNNFKLFITILSISIIILSYIFLKKYEDFNINYQLYLIGSLIILMMPIIYYLYSDIEKNFLPIFYLVTSYFFISYFMYYLLNWGEGLDDNGKRLYVNNANTSEVLYSLKIFFLGILMFNIGYFITKFFFKKNNFFSNYLKISNINELVLISLIVNLFTIIFFYLIKIDIYLNQFNQLKIPLIYLSIALSFFVILKTTSFFKYIFLIPLIIFFLIELIGGSYVFPFKMLFFMYFLYFSFTKKFLLSPILIIFIMSFVIHSSKHEFRKLIWDTQSIDGKTVTFNKNLTQKYYSFIWAYKKDIKRFKNYNTDSKYRHLYNRNFSRLFHSPKSLIIVTKNTPNKIPYWNGQSYKIILTKIIPRIIWKDKPSDRLGNEFGRRYNILGKADYSTSWNMPVLNEFYANFGIKGVMIGMFIIGLLLRLLLNFFVIEKNNGYSILVGSATLYPFFYFESHLSMISGALIQQFIFLFIVIFLCKKTLLYLKI